MPKVDKLRRSSRHKPISTASTHSIASSGSRSSSWSAKDDETLITARATGGNWNQIAPKHFPSKSPNACRKRHERLMERQNAEQWDGVELEVLAQVYMDARRQMWAILAAQVGEKWQIVEQKVSTISITLLAFIKSPVIIMMQHTVYGKGAQKSAPSISFRAEEAGNL